MSKYVFGVWLTTIAFAILFTYNVNLVSGIASAIAVWGIAYMINGTIETVLKLVFRELRSNK